MMVPRVRSLWAAIAPVFGPGRFVVARLAGQLHGEERETTALYVGSGVNLPFLRRYFFGAATTEVLGWRVTPLRPLRSVGGLPWVADLHLRDVPPVWGWALPSTPGVLQVPAWVRQELRLTLPGHGLRWPVPRRAAREVWRHLRRQGWTLELGTERRDLEEFYREHYVPYVTARHGEDAVVVSWDHFLIRVRGRAIAWLRQGQQRIAGMVLLRRRNVLRFGWFGAASCPAPAGASEVLDALVLRHALERGVTDVILGNARPCVADGVFRYKRRLGATVQPCTFPQSTLEIDARSGHSGVLACLRERPLLTRQHGRLRQLDVDGALGPRQGLQQVPHGDTG